LRVPRVEAGGRAGGRDRAGRAAGGTRGRKRQGRGRGALRRQRRPGAVSQAGRLVIPGRAEGASLASITPDLSILSVIARIAFMDSGLLAAPVIGPATSGRIRWLGPGMTPSVYVNSAIFSSALSAMNDSSGSLAEAA